MSVAKSDSRREDKKIEAESCKRSIVLYLELNQYKDGFLSEHFLTIGSDYRIWMASIGCYSCLKSYKCYHLQQRKQNISLQTFKPTSGVRLL